jgi:hypothetical protein
MNTDRDYADKAWLKEQTPPLVRLMDVVAWIAVVVFLIAIVAVALAATVRAADDGLADWKAFLPLYARNRDPINAPRCPRYNAADERLKYSIAVQPDGDEWLLDCRYEPGVRA